MRRVLNLFFTVTVAAFAGRAANLAVQTPTVLIQPQSPAVYEGKKPAQSGATASAMPASARANDPAHEVDLLKEATASLEGDLKPLRRELESVSATVRIDQGVIMFDS